MKKKDLFYSSILLFFLVVIIFQRTTVLGGLFGYYDELYALLSIPCIVKHVIDKMRKKELIVSSIDSLIITCLSLFVFSGVIGNLFYPYQDKKYALVDLFINLKFFLSIVTTVFILSNIENKEILKKSIVACLRTFVVLFFILYIIEYKFDVFDATHEIRYGFKCIKIFFEHVTFFGASLATCALLLIALSKNKKDLIYPLLALVLTLLTFRTKLILFVMACGGILVLMKFKKISKKLKITIISMGSIACLLGLVVVSDSIKYYFVDIPDSARSALLSTSFKLAKDHYPFGTGFATFGSDMSAHNYSVIYSEYGIQDVYGLREGEAFFVSDNFWPMILGQAGVIGMISYGIIICALLYKLRIYKGKRKYAGIMAVLYLLISSTSESAFVNSFSLGFGIIYAIILNDEFMEEKII